MKHKLTWYMMTASLALLVAGCGSEQGQNDAAPPSSLPTPTATATLVPAPAPTPSPTPIVSESPTPEPTPETVAITYRMNGNYDIVPIDENGERKVVLLTFDDGPKAEETLLPILDTLDKHEAKAIFFVNGFRVKQNPELLKTIHERGQIIGNHSYDHINLSKQDKETTDYQIDETQKIIEELTGSAPVFMRPPHGMSSEYLRAKLKQQGILRMNWSNGSLDYTNLNDPQAVIDNVMSQLHKGSNILMHELAWTAEALDELLIALKAEGYSFVDPRAIDPTQP